MLDDLLYAYFGWWRSLCELLHGCRSLHEWEKIFWPTNFCFGMCYRHIFTVLFPWDMLVFFWSFFFIEMMFLLFFFSSVNQKRFIIIVNLRILEMSYRFQTILGDSLEIRQNSEILATLQSLPKISQVYKKI